MSRKRTTLDLWDIQVNYGQGWESETEEFSKLLANEQLETYRKNITSPVRAVKKREKLSNYTPEELEGIAKQIQAAKERHRLKRQARRAAKV